MTINSALGGTAGPLLSAVIKRLDLERPKDEEARMYLSPLVFSKASLRDRLIFRVALSYACFEANIIGKGRVFIRTNVMSDQHDATPSEAGELQRSLLTAWRWLGIGS